MTGSATSWRIGRGEQIRRRITPVEVSNPDLFADVKAICEGRQVFFEKGDWERLSVTDDFRAKVQSAKQGDAAAIAEVISVVEIQIIDRGYGVRK